MRIDRGKVREESRYNGKYVLVTNDHELSAEEIAITYWKLKRIESSFRSMKSLEKLIPVHHRTEERIKGHVFACVLAHLLERALEKRLKGKVDLSVAKAIQELGRIEAVEIELNGGPTCSAPRRARKPVRSLKLCI